MFIVPIGTARVSQNGVPIVAIALAVALVVVFLTVSGRFERGARDERQATTALVRAFAAAPYVVVPEDVLQAADAPFTAAVTRTREWAATIQAPEREEPVEAEAVHASVLALERSLEAGTSGARSPLEDRGAFEALVATTTPVSRAAAQAELDAQAAAWREARAANPCRRYGFAPGSPTLRGALAHLFITVDWVALIFAATLVLATAAGLLELWPSWAVLLLFVLGGLAGAGALTASATRPDAVFLGPDAAVAALLGAYLLRCHGEQLRFGYLSVAGLVPRFRTFEAPAWVMLPVWLLGLGITFARSETFDSSALWASAAALGVGGVLALIVRAAGLEQELEPSEGSESGPGGLLAAELQRKRERWGLPPSGAAAGLHRAEQRPGWSGEPLTFEGGLPDPDPSSPQGTAELDPSLAASRPAPRAEPSAAPPTRLGRPLAAPAPRAPTPPEPPAPVLPPPVVVPVSSLPPLQLEAPAKAPLAPEPAQALPPLFDEPPAAEPSLPELPRPTYAVAFRSPEAQPIPEAVRGEADALAMALPVALRTDDNRQILAAFVRAGQESVGALDPTEAIRLARALAAEGYRGQALKATRVAAARDPRGPYAARAILFEARLHLEAGARTEARGLLEDLLRRFPGDPVRDVAKDLLGSLG